MTQTEWDPLKDLAGVRERMNRMFESALARTNFDADGGLGAWIPLADICETEDGVRADLELPGVEQGDIEVRIEGDELLVQGERRIGGDEEGEQFHRVERSYGKFARRFRVPAEADRSSVHAAFRNGVLTITLRKKESAERGPIRVTIA